MNLEISLSKEKIDAIFETELNNQEPHQQNILIALYKVVFPNWTDIEKINGYPSTSRETNEYIFNKFIQFDRMFHPQIMNGGLWLNNGFSSLDETIPNWVVKPCEIILKGM